MFCFMGFIFFAFLSKLKTNESLKKRIRFHHMNLRKYPSLFRDFNLNSCCFISLIQNSSVFTLHSSALDWFRQKSMCLLTGSFKKKIAKYNRQLPSDKINKSIYWRYRSARDMKRKKTKNCISATAFLWSFHKLCLGQN